MFCPECRCEYRPGFHECADCGVPLVDELPPVVQPPPTPEAAKWELDRRDSLNIAFVKGAFVGFACAEAVATITRFFVSTLFFRNRFVPGPPMPWVEIAYTLLAMLPPLGIVIGGYVGRSRRR